MSANLYPVALDLNGKRCIVVGGGVVGARRAAGLWEAGADVTVVSPAFHPSLRELAQAGRVHLVEAAFRPEHLTNAFLVVAATNQPNVNTEIAAAARERSVLLNLAAPAASEETGDFATMAAVRRGDLLIALTTGGAGPALTARLKQEMEMQFGPEWAEYVALLGEMRAALKQSDGNNEGERSGVLRRLASDPTLLAQIAAGDVTGARQEAERLCRS